MKAAGTLRTGPRWLLLCLLLFGVVSMHHFVTSEAHHQSSGMTMDAPASAPAQHEPEQPAPSPKHDLLHLCLAVMGAIAGLLLLGLLLAMAIPVHVPSLRPERRIQRVDRPPKSSGRDLLSSVCVLRL
ncbi:hypothetical protein JOF56_011082 [Kibdelosporangium banguiense]|uniref:Uncharacterized protein n=1 Tax=Kibdelosporangium banguiense TaxID=1365924 RepID=A0ABS4U229_9PSEU|nr:hypothetical protein [Kibdelosporangium banguiense]MBP2330697.1 hypothetical protein [Kibdelosporangium banguiense]